jgi:Nuclease A inhibitor-like protein
MMNRNEVEKLTEGLLYMSESDAPLKYFELGDEAARQWPPQTAALFLEMNGEEPNVPLQESAPEKFFEALLVGNEEREDQVKALRKTIMNELENVRLYRVGEIEIEIYLLGKDGSGKVCGLQTLSVET